MAQLSNLSPGVRSLLRRAQAADIGGYGSVAARFDPRQYGSIASRTYPGLFQQPSGQDAQNAQTDQLIQNNNRVLTLRRQQLELSDPELSAALYRRRQQVQYARQNKILSPNTQYADLFGGYDGNDSEPDGDADQ